MNWHSAIAPPSVSQPACTDVRFPLYTCRQSWRWTTEVRTTSYNYPLREFLTCPGDRQRSAATLTLVPLRLSLGWGGGSALSHSPPVGRKPRITSKTEKWSFPQTYDFNLAYYFFKTCVRNVTEESKRVLVVISCPLMPNQGCLHIWSSFTSMIKFHISDFSEITQLTTFVIFKNTKEAHAWQLMFLAGILGTAACNRNMSVEISNDNHWLDLNVKQLQCKRYDDL